MPKTYVTFGQNHAHAISGITFDKDCVAVIKTEEPNQGRDKAFEIFGREFCMEYPEEHFDHNTLEHFPRGLIEVPL